MMFQRTGLVAVSGKQIITRKNRLAPSCSRILLQREQKQQQKYRPKDLSFLITINNSNTIRFSSSSSSGNYSGRNMKFAFPPPDIQSVPIVGEEEERFPIHRIYCVGRNYKEHVAEMGGDPDRELPFFFTKPADAVVDTSSGSVEIPYPLATNNLHYEIELVIAIGKGGVNIQESEATNHVFGYAAGIDFTRRDLQKEAKDKRRPWDTSKGFDRSAPLSAITKMDKGDEDRLKDAGIWLSVNGDMKQTGKLKQMTWSVSEIISILSKQFYLQPGDLIFTGTPQGVGPTVSGDQIVGGIDGLEQVKIKIMQ